MTPALWAVVDAVYEHRYRRALYAWQIAGKEPVRVRRARGRRRTRDALRLGWWRSCWPVGGVA